jgi:radical SAM superfamily enzyme YgiQ (UPF0313 family)
LGIGYLASTLRLHGYAVELIDFEIGVDKIVETVQALDPILVGFSLIFQLYINNFRQLIWRLRKTGLRCHFTIGGHFPSLSYQETLQIIPELDSVVRFEGELTLLELVNHISADQDWHDILGIAFKQGTDVVSNPLRPLIADLDKLPYPERTFKPNEILGHKSVSIIASRGCARTCSFCSIHMFYRTAPGKVVRTRKPAEVVREMAYLYDNHGITIFLFQDDDFPLFGPVWRRWAHEFINELHLTGLANRVIWKISCRADAVEPDLFAQMRDAGLYFVYMGLESGTEEGLKVLNKHITAEQNIRAVEILNSLGLMLSFGFMLFEPSSTFESIRFNLDFLRKIVDDGTLAATFCRMIPYDGTPIKVELARTGRLRGNITHPDYDFLDPRLGDFYSALTRSVDLTDWVHGYQSLSPQINYAWTEVGILERLFPSLAGMSAYKQALQTITKTSNDRLFSIVEDTSFYFSDGKPNPWSNAIIRKNCEEFLNNLVNTRNDFILRHQDIILKALSDKSHVSPVEYVEERSTSIA